MTNTQVTDSPTDNGRSFARPYIPAIGDRVRLKTWNDYHSLDLPQWSVLTCVGIDGLNVVCQRSLTADGKQDGELVTVPHYAIDKPIGWQDRYTIRVNRDQLKTVLGMLPRGLVVRQSQYIGDSSVQFQPMDDAETSHWKFTAVTDRIPATDTRELIKVVLVESEEGHVNRACHWCNGSKVYTDGDARRFPCTCKDGRENQYFGEMDAKQRKAVIRLLEMDGWHVWYQRRGQIWRMERETLVKDWGKDVRPEYAGLS